MGTNFDPAEDAAKYGIIPRVMDEVFSALDSQADEVDSQIEVSYLEIYNEHVRDLLLAHDQDPPKRGYQFHKDDFGNYDVKGVTSRTIHSLEELAGVLQEGGIRRATAATQMNATSSRSHAVLTVRLEQQPKGGGRGDGGDDAAAVAGMGVAEEGDEGDGSDQVKRVSVFRMVDLAGSERSKKTGAEGERLREANNINQSLTTLGRCIVALATKQKHVPFRNSKLTQLLTNSLGGNSATLMVACVSPADSNFDETLNTLRYADTASSIENKPRVNADPTASLAFQLRGCLRELRHELARLYAQGVEVDAEILHRYGINSASSSSSPLPPPRPRCPGTPIHASNKGGSALGGSNLARRLAAAADERPITGSGASGQPVSLSSNQQSGLVMQLRERVAELQAEVHRANALLQDAREEARGMGERGRWAVAQAGQLLEENASMKSELDRMTWRYRTISEALQQQAAREEQRNGQEKDGDEGEKEEEEEEEEGGGNSIAGIESTVWHAAGEKAAQDLLRAKDKEVARLREEIRRLNGDPRATAEMSSRRAQRKERRQRRRQRRAGAANEHKAASGESGAEETMSHSDKEAPSAGSRRHAEAGSSTGGSSGTSSGSESDADNDNDTDTGSGSDSESVSDELAAEGPTEMDVAHIRSQMELRGQLEQVSALLQQKEALFAASDAEAMNLDQYGKLKEEFMSEMRRNEDEVASLEARCESLAAELEQAKQQQSKTRTSRTSIRKKDDEIRAMRQKISQLQQEMQSAQRHQRQRDRQADRMLKLKNEIESYKKEKVRLEKAMRESSRKYLEEKKQHDRDRARALKAERAAAMRLRKAQDRIAIQERQLEAARHKERVRRQKDELLRHRRANASAIRAGAGATTTGVANAASSGNGAVHRSASGFGGGGSAVIALPRTMAPNRPLTARLELDLAGDTSGLNASAAALVEESIAACHSELQDEDRPSDGGSRGVGGGSFAQQEGVNLGDGGELAAPISSKSVDSHCQSIVRRVLYYRTQSSVWKRRAERYMEERAALARQVDERVRQLQSERASKETENENETDAGAPESDSQVDQWKRDMVSLTLRVQEAQYQRQSFMAMLEEEGLQRDYWIRRVARETELPRRIRSTIGTRLLNWFVALIVHLNIQLQVSQGQLEREFADERVSAASSGCGGKPSFASPHAMQSKAAGALHERIEELESELESVRNDRQREIWRLEQEHTMAQRDDAETIASLRLQLTRMASREDRHGGHQGSLAEETDNGPEGDTVAALRREVAQQREAVRHAERIMSEYFTESQRRTDEVEASTALVERLTARVEELEAKLATERKKAKLASMPRRLERITASPGKEMAERGQAAHQAIMETAFPSGQGSDKIGGRHGDEVATAVAEVLEGNELQEERDPAYEAMQVSFQHAGEQPDGGEKGDDDDEEEEGEDSVDEHVEESSAARGEHPTTLERFIRKCTPTDQQRRRHGRPNSLTNPGQRGISSFSSSSLSGRPLTGDASVGRVDRLSSGDAPLSRRQQASAGERSSSPAAQLQRPKTAPAGSGEGEEDALKREAWADDDEALHADEKDKDDGDDDDDDDVESAVAEDEFEAGGKGRSALFSGESGAMDSVMRTKSVFQDPKLDATNELGMAMRRQASLYVERTGFNSSTPRFPPVEREKELRKELIANEVKGRHHHHRRRGGKRGRDGGGVDMAAVQQAIQRAQQASGALEDPSSKPGARRSRSSRGDRLSRSRSQEGRRPPRDVATGGGARGKARLQQFLQRGGRERAESADPCERALKVSEQRRRSLLQDDANVTGKENAAT